MLLNESVFHSLFMAKYMPLDAYTASCLSVHSLVDVWVVSPIGSILKSKSLKAWDHVIITQILG